MKTATLAEILLVQRCYPQIYLACHADHVRARSTPYRLSSQDSSILVHVDIPSGISPRRLASHLGILPSTLSAAIRRLTTLGYLSKKVNPRDHRSFTLHLTALGSKAMSATSVLDSRRVSALLRRLTLAQRRRALQGLQLLASASLQISKGKRN